MTEPCANHAVPQKDSIMSDVTLLTTEMHEALRAKYHEAWKLLQTAAPDVDQLNNAECEAWQRRRDTLLFHDEPMRCDGCGKTIAEHDRLGRCGSSTENEVAK